MTIVSMTEILKPAFAQRYGVPAFNMVNDASLAALLAAAEAKRAPVIIQVSVKTVKFWGAKVLGGLFQQMASTASVPTCLHLDHCPYVEVIEECIDAGWSSVLFDGSHLPFDECLETTKRVVAMAHARGVCVEGEAEAVKGVEDGIGSDEEGPAIPLDQAVRFCGETGIDCFAPAIGTAHGMYDGEPQINVARVSEIAQACPAIPLVLHGGTGLGTDVFHDLISRGMAKVNISTQLKIVYAQSTNNYLQANLAKPDPLKQIQAGMTGMQAMAEDFIDIFGCAGKA